MSLGVRSSGEAENTQMGRWWSSERSVILLCLCPGCLCVCGQGVGLFAERMHGAVQVEDKSPAVSPRGGLSHS